MRKQLKNRKVKKYQKAYFITISAYNRQNLFGQIKAGKMHLSEAGKIIKYCWRELEKNHLEINLGEFVIMPNHIHGLVFAQNLNLFKPVFSLVDSSKALDKIIHEFKNHSTKLIHSVQSSSDANIWQKDYSEILLQNDFEINQTREYIINNVFSWDLDPENISKEVIL